MDAMWEEMKLPAGKTCSDCVHLRRCVRVLGCTTPERTSCDFYPNFERKPMATTSIRTNEPAPPSMRYAPLTTILRGRAKLCQNDGDVDPERADDSALFLALARLLENAELGIVAVRQAFGAPGDWGYGTEIGDALAEIYKGKS